MSKNKRDLIREAELNDIPLDIPEDEIWTYQIEGLQAPRILDKSIKAKTKALIILSLLVAIGLSIFFSIRAVSNTEFKYSPAETGVELVKYSNPGQSTEVTVDFAEGDPAQPVTEIHEYAFNCDEKLVIVTIGKDVRKIDGKSFYSCKNLENIIVDPENEWYCDLDGVLYNKDLTEVICYPEAHNFSLMRNAGYSMTFPENGSITEDDFNAGLQILSTAFEQGSELTELSADDQSALEKFKTFTGASDLKKFAEDYDRTAGIYVVPSTVETVGKLAFAYSDIKEIYLPQGVKSIGTLGFFKAEKLKEIYSYTSDETIDGTTLEQCEKKIKAYRSLPDGLETIGSDAFTYDRGLTYMYIPLSVKEIGHHAFFNTAFKSGDEIEGLSAMNVAASEEEFDDVTVGESWLPKLEAGLFKKNIEVAYSSSRE